MQISPVVPSPKTGCAPDQQASVLSGSPRPRRFNELSFCIGLEEDLRAGEGRRDAGFLRARHQTTSFPSSFLIAEWPDAGASLSDKID